MFYAAFLENERHRFIFGFVEINSTLPPEIYIISKSTKDVFVTIRAPRDPTFEQIMLVLPPDEVKHIEVPSSMRMLNGVTGHKGTIKTSIYAAVLCENLLCKEHNAF